MRGFARIVVALVAVVVALGAFAPAYAQDVEWKWVTVFWDSGGVVQKRQYQLNDEADSVRTGWIDLRNVAWHAFDAQTTVKGIPVVFTAEIANTATDSLYYLTERGDANNLSRSVYNGVTLSLTASEIFGLFDLKARTSRSSAA